MCLCEAIACRLLSPDPFHHTYAQQMHARAIERERERKMKLIEIFAVGPGSQPDDVAVTIGDRPRLQNI